MDIDNDVVILADNTDAEICAEIQAVAADSGELELGRRHGCGQKRHPGRH